MEYVHNITLLAILAIMSLQMLKLTIITIIYSYDIINVLRNRTIMISINLLNTGKQLNTNYFNNYIIYLKVKVVPP